jgi:hypothetical protein
MTPRHPAYSSDMMPRHSAYSSGVTPRGYLFPAMKQNLTATNLKDIHPCQQKIETVRLLRDKCLACGADYMQM